ncbi:TPA: lysozyme, partial [Klebsiella michiganensis]|nr:lysozyme [Klebsiella michiganensis]
VSLAYNIGTRALSSSTLMKKLNSGDVKGAADEFLRWNKSGGKAMPGLTNRRKAEREVFLS